MRTSVPAAFSDRHGRLGAVVFIDFRGAEGTARYSFETHGMTNAEILAKRDAIVAHHATRTARVRSLQGGLSKPVAAGFHLTDVVIRSRGTDVELFARLSDNSGERIEIVRVYPDVTLIPSDQEIQQMFRDACTSAAARRAAAADHRNAVAALVAGG